VDPEPSDSGPTAEGEGPRPAPRGVTLHLTPAEVWEAQSKGQTYVPEGFAAEGFIHCTDGEDRLLVPANAYYRDDPRRFVVLEVDVDRLTAEVRYDDETAIYPHIYGPMETTAVVGLRRADRAADGTFLGFPTR
jgi:uncharacterized protein (DUF952 family)